MVESHIRLYAMKTFVLTFFFAFSITTLRAKEMEASSFWGFWIMIGGDEKPFVVNVKPWGEVTRFWETDDDTTIYEGSWRKHPKGIQFTWKDFSPAVMHRSPAGIDIMVYEEKGSESTFPMVKLEKGLVGNGLTTEDFLNTYRDRTHDLDTDLSERQKAYKSPKPKKEDLKAIQREELVEKVQLPSGVRFAGKWSYLGDDGSIFEVELRSNGSVWSAEQTTAPIGTWMVTNQRALINYQSGWKQVILEDASSASGFFLISVEPQTNRAWKFPVRQTEEASYVQVPTARATPLLQEQSSQKEEDEVSSVPATPSSRRARTTLGFEY